MSERMASMPPSALNEAVWPSQSSRFDDCEYWSVAENSRLPAGVMTKQLDCPSKAFTSRAASMSWLL